MNRLAREPSPYLRQHKDNPVDWYPWGDEALARAKAQDKPILLSVGYSACHWCHVMAHESFENPDIARRMNEWFINVKVDREERPDVDQIYQGVVQLMGRGGGWPLTVFLTPDLRPFFGGTYFPAEARYGLPGFPTILERLHDLYVNRRKDVEEQAEQFREGLSHLGAYGLDAAPGDLRTDDVVGAAGSLEREIDRRHGGFGGAPKFPNPMNVAMLLRAHRRSRETDLLSAVVLTLEKMARGGVYDQLGGGFHRYSVDERWLVPHFEKMLYDNAQLLHLYAEAQQVTPQPLWTKVARETVEYVCREMTSPDGAFYAAQDADSEGEEGKFFVWTPKQVDDVFGATSELAEVARRYFDITERGNFEHTGATVLETRKTVAELAAALGRDQTTVAQQVEAARARMLAAREKRVKPGLDDKVLTGWNGLMIRGLAFASRVFAEPDWAVRASRAADFLLARMWDGQTLKRSFQGEPRIDGFIEDYGDFALGLVALFQATFEPRYLEAAMAIADRAVELFWVEEKQAYLSAPRGQKDLVTAAFALHDNAYPSGASTLTDAHVQLAALTGQTRYLDQAGRYLRKLRDGMVRNPFAFGHLWLAADAYVEGAAELTIIGPRSELRAFLDAANRTYAPTVAVIGHDSSRPVPPVLRDTVGTRPPVDGKAAAYLCRNFSCEAPLTDASATAERLSDVAG